MMDEDELRRREAEFHKRMAFAAFVFAVVMAVGVVLVLWWRGVL